MSYSEAIERLLVDFSQDEKQQLIDRFDIDLSQPERMLDLPRSRDVFLKRLTAIEKKAMKRLHPERISPEPTGIICFYCDRDESEVSDMAKHESGFNVCSVCIENCAAVLREKPTS